ncbi:MAG: 16S rRNA (adenine(1518)-N(6)/adenine(1519)-N(6))-dimethyltransferase RsmA [Gammaproteobacteria bacterium]|nr:16S rRNA (adenine(1518)-N(6)/adenine(1519)-N(6))-dimethyltransferase RsmA [Gammaproteobacteria bacterium]
MSHRPRKRFGQHFLRDPSVVSRIVAAIDPAAGDHIVEIGPGEGILTGPLAALPVTLDAVEIDRDLAAALRTRYAAAENVRIHEADALKFDFAALGDRLRVVGNLPYNISTPLLFRLVAQRDAIRDMHFMLQREVVARMAASPGGREYGRLTVMLACSMQVERLFDVPPQAFRPPPKVQSSVVRLVPRAERLEIRDERLFAALVTGAFSRRRKTLRNALADWLTPEAIAEEGIDPTLRPERLAPEEFARLADRALRERDDALE